jgi:hypothetical protein
MPVQRQLGVMALLLVSLYGQTNSHLPVKADSSVLSISPSGPVNVVADSHRQFTANAIGSGGNIALLWSIEGEVCAKVDCGSISPDGLYTAPRTITERIEIRIVAREINAPFLTTSEQVVVQSWTKKQKIFCKSLQPGYCTPEWEIHQLFVPFVW